MPLRILNQPFPINTWRRYWLRGLSFGLFVFLFLSVFQPFSLNLFPTGQLLFTTSVYGLTTAVVITGGSLLLIRVVAPYIKEERWTLGKQILWNTFLMVCITFANVVVTQWMHNIALPVSWYFTMLKWVLMLGVLPVAFAELITYNHFLRKNILKAEEVTNQLQHLRTPYRQTFKTFSPERKTAATLVIDSEVEEADMPEDSIVTLKGDNLGDVLEVSPRSILAVQALDNYVNVFYEVNGRLKTAMLRNTLTNIAMQVTELPHLYRSHRGWLVNTKRVVKVEGNAQGLKLTVELLGHQVPVSRSNIAGYRESLKSGTALVDA